MALLDCARCQWCNPKFITFLACLSVLQAQASTSGAEAAPGAAHSGWASWAVAGLSTLGLFGNNGNGNGNGKDLRLSTNGSLGGAGRASETGNGNFSSPLAQDWHQRSLVQQAHWKQHEAAHKQHQREQHTIQDAAAAHSQHLPVSTLQDKQLLPAAVRSFQHHKLMRADSLFGDSNSIKAAQSAGLNAGSEPWSPTWLLRSFVPFGTPASPSALSTAESSMAQQHQSSWSLLDACRVGAEPFPAGC